MSGRKQQLEWAPGNPDLNSMIELKKIQQIQLKQIELDRMRMDKDEDLLVASLAKEDQLMAALQSTRKEDARRVELSDSVDENAGLLRDLRSEQEKTVDFAGLIAATTKECRWAERELVSQKTYAASCTRDFDRAQAKLSRSQSAYQALQKSGALLAADVAHLLHSLSAIAMQLKQADAENDFSAAEVDINARRLLELERRVVAERLVLRELEGKVCRMEGQSAERLHDSRKAAAAVARLEEELRAVVRRRDDTKALLEESEETMAKLTPASRFERVHQSGRMSNLSSLMHHQSNNQHNKPLPSGSLSSEMDGNPSVSTRRAQGPGWGGSDAAVNDFSTSSRPRLGQGHLSRRWTCWESDEEDCGSGDPPPPSASSPHRVGDVDFDHMSADCRRTSSV